ncbi:MAG: bifunctional 4-hydroxy-2-oxoglutarate aldolase/2-dehydro-3-deoxy-phosphogluconate aldolase [Nevskia sp.]|nr:bifunctional 4-hydroxy-2-oxoglutarate aldolase/2-dehydro-3-deoxy-phosphogluconate aldolase [Nevskia sp.]
MDIAAIMQAGPVIPVIVIDDAAKAVPLARALLAGGVRVLEVTMRTPAALDAVREIRAGCPQAICGVGTVTSPADLERAIAAGAQFAVSPALTPALRAAAAASGLPFLPGVMTPTEALAAREAGITALKLFPATQAGGTGMLKAIGSVFAELRFCPTGGITPATARDYLALPNVACVGGSWLAPAALMQAGDWGGIEKLAREAAALR